MKGKLIFLICFLLMVKVFADEREEITPPAGPFVKNGWDIFVSADFLWWQAIQEGLKFATTGKVYTVDFPREIGFRAGVGFYPHHDGWDIFARFTHLHSSSTRHVRSDEGTISAINLSLSQITNSELSQITSARSHWHLHYHIVDLELGRNFFLSRFLKTRLFWGLRGSWIDQKWKSRYVANQVTLGSTGPLPGSVTTDQDHDSWGIGIRMGANGTWTLYKGWSIVSNIAFSGVWSDYDNRRIDRVQIGNGQAVATANISSDPESIVPCIEMMLGMEGEWWLKDERTHISLQVGWENQVWINYGHFISFRNQNSGDLSLNGAVVKLRFDF
ncbi:MAG: hypothetical protein K1060chlam2_01250 [Chlamydiae bacterium]|nr:hypothetical protein [Chlamydiota bacterium]